MHKNHGKRTVEITYSPLCCGRADELNNLAKENKAFGTLWYNIFQLQLDNW